MSTDPALRFQRSSTRPPEARPLMAPGQIGVDYEKRVDFDRLRSTGSRGRRRRWRPAERVHSCSSTSTTFVTLRKLGSVERWATK